MVISMIKYDVATGDTVERAVINYHGMSECVRIPLRKNGET